jgi:hypothetical protein
MLEEHDLKNGTWENEAVDLGVYPLCFKRNEERPPSAKK